MEYQTAKPRLRIERVILALIMAFLLMCVGYVGGNLLEKFLKKKMAEKDEKEKPKELEKHEDDDDTEWEALYKDKDEIVEEEAIMGFQIEEKESPIIMPLKEAKKITTKRTKHQK